MKHLSLTIVCIELACLRHLRELRADGNRIQSLEGLNSLDGLLKLSVQGNELSQTDFLDCHWYVSQDGG